MFFNHVSDFDHSCTVLKRKLKLDSGVYVNKILFNLNFQGNRKFEVFSQGTYDFQNFRNKTLFIADYEKVKKCAFDWLAAKLWLKKALFHGMFALLNE